MLLKVCLCWVRAWHLVDCILCVDRGLVVGGTLDVFMGSVLMDWDGDWGGFWVGCWWV